MSGNRQSIKVTTSLDGPAFMRPLAPVPASTQLLKSNVERTEEAKW